MGDYDDTQLAFAANSMIWEDIELAESFLVCCAYEKALSKSSSVLRYANSLEHVEQTELLQIKESVGMVVVQSLKELGRSHDIIKELVLLFGEATAIPTEVLLAGACILISEAPSVAQSFLEEFLSKWSCVDENHCVLEVESTSPSYATNSGVILTLDKYMEFVELYAVVLLGKVLKTTDTAITWLKKAEIPETKREDLMRKLNSLHSHKREKTTLLSQRDKQEADISQNGLSLFEGSSEPSRTANVSKQSIVKVSSRVQPFFGFFRSVTLKFGNMRLVITTTKVLLGCLACLVAYFIKRKRQTLLRVAKKRVNSAMNALMDLWQLAFSYQVNPLAAVQPLPAGTRST